MNTLEGKSVVVFGGSGRLGKDLIPLLKAAGASVVAPSHDEIDIASASKLWQCIMWHNPDIVINLAAYTDVPNAETLEGKDACVRTNILGNKYVAEATHYQGSKLVYISSDYVYPGIKGDYDIEDVGPRSSYGMTKYIGEWFCHPTDLVIRTSMKARGSWGENAHTKVFHPVWTNADWIDIIAEKIVGVVADEQVGVINLGTERKLLSDLAREEYGDVELISPDELDLPYPYPKDCSMRLSN